MATISEALATAFQHHQAGQFQQAEQIYRQVLAIDPNNVDALHLLGLIALHVGDHTAAVAYIGRAIALDGTKAPFHSNLGNVLKAQGKLDEAALAYHHALELQPDYVPAHYNLGIVYQDQGKLDVAVSRFRRALELNPDHVDAYNNLGNVLNERGKLNEAITCYRRGLDLQPNHARTWCNLGSALNAQGKLDEAINCCRKAIELDPEFVEAHCNLGNAFIEQNKFGEAAESLRRALKFNPDYVKAHQLFGNLFVRQGKLDEAESSYWQVLKLAPDNAEAHNSLASVLKDQAKLKDAVEHFEAALRVKPHDGKVHSNLLYTLYFCPEYDAARIYEEHSKWNRQEAEPLAAFIKPHTNDATAHRRLRIGYVSPNLRLHAEAYFLVPLLASHNREHFEIFCYSDVAAPDDITAKFRSHSDVWRETNGLSDEAVAQLVRDDQIDILIDLTMHMAHGRPLLFARKPAPVQVCWLAYQGTTGLSTIDYRFTDQNLDPPGLFDHYYSEESVWLESFWCYDPLTKEPAVNSLPALEKGHITFGSLNNFCKVNDDVLQLWAHVLRAVGRSRLMLLAAEGSHRQRTRDFLAAEGIAPERVEFRFFMPRPEYLKLYHEIDIGLDTFPYNGQTTTLDAIWMGVPVVTIEGHQTSAARAGTSRLRNLGMQTLIADSPNQFVSIAVEMANDLRCLGTLRASLRQRLEESPLMNAPRFAGNVEVAYRTMWQGWCKGSNPPTADN